MFEIGEIVRVSQKSGHTPLRGKLARVVTNYYTSDAATVEILGEPEIDNIYVYVVKLSPLEQLARCAEVE